MKICLFTSSLNRGGAERVFVNLANHWVGQGHAVDFVVMSPEGGFRESLSPKVNLVDLSERRGLLPARIDFIRLFAHYLKSRQPDQVFATLTYVTITALIARRLSGYRGRLVVRQANSIQNQSDQLSFVRFWNWMGYHFCYRWADTILVNSKNSESEMHAMLPRLRDKVELVYNPVIVCDEHSRVAESEQIPMILASGRFAPQKDYPTLLKAFKEVLNQRSARLVILGDGPLRGDIETMIRDLKIGDHVELVGYVEDTEEYYSRAKLFVLASRWEGFPNVLVEALAAGVPVVATDGKGASREIVEPILPGNVVPVGAVEDLANKIVANLGAEYCPTSLCDYVNENFGLPKIAEKYLSI